MPELSLSIKAKRELDDEESEQWSNLKNREKTIRGLEKGFEEALKKFGLPGFEITVKVRVK